MSDYRKLDQDARKAIAATEETPAEVLEQLAQDKDPEVRRAVAGSPNTPTKTLLKLGKEFPEEIISNPIFSLLLLENPRFVSLALARSSTTSVETLIQLAETTDTEILEAIARNPNTPIAALEKIWNQPFYSSVKPLALTRMVKDPKTPISVLERFIHSSHNTDIMLARWDIASHPNLSPSALEILTEKLIEDYAMFRQTHQQLKDRIHPELRAAFRAVRDHPNRTPKVLKLLTNLPS